jgi:hypothetical protein
MAKQPDGDAEKTPPKSKTYKTQTGATYRTQHMERWVKIYPIDETGMKMLSVLNNLTTLFASLGVGCAMRAIDLHNAALVAAAATKNNQNAIPVPDGSGWLWLLAGIFGVSAAISYCVRDSEIKRIKTETEVISAT